MVNWQRGVMRLMRITNHEVIVTGIEDFTARYRRIHFSGPELLAQLDEVFPTLWTRLWFPHPEKGERHLSQRGYTFAAIDLEAGTFSLDFVLHGDLGEDAPQHCGQRTWCRWRWVRNRGHRHRRHRHGGRRARRSVGGPGP